MRCCQITCPLSLGKWTGSCRSGGHLQQLVHQAVSSQGLLEVQDHHHQVVPAGQVRAAYLRVHILCDIAPFSMCVNQSHGHMQSQDWEREYLHRSLQEAIRTATTPVDH
jgi:hypothetical protein